MRTRGCDAAAKAAPPMLRMRCDAGAGVQRGMETVLNSDQDHAEIMALYVDTCQRGRLGKLGEKESEAAVLSCVEMLRYLAVGSPCPSRWRT